MSTTSANAASAAASKSAGHRPSRLPNAKQMLESSSTMSGIKPFAPARIPADQHQFNAESEQNLREPARIGTRDPDYNAGASGT